MIKNEARAAQLGVAPEIGNFIENLSALDTGRRALFKRNAGEDLAGSRRILPTFYRLLPHSINRENDIETYFLVATLYASHDRQSDAGNFAHSMKRIVTPANKDGVSRRLAIILDSHRMELPFRLRQSVALLRSHECPVNWTQLLADLLRWDDPKRRIQKAWAKTFFGSPN